MHAAKWLPHPPPGWMVALNVLLTIIAVNFPHDPSHRRNHSKLAYAGLQEILRPLAQPGRSGKGLCP